MANRKIEDVEGIGAATGDKLRAAGITDTDGLLDAARGPTDRKALAAATGLTDAQVLKFANMVDLYRINGVGSEFSELLEAAGVDTVPELGTRNPANLTQAMADVNGTKKLVRQVPTEAEVTRWVAEAKTLPRMLEY